MDTGLPEQTGRWSTAPQQGSSRGRPRQRFSDLQIVTWHVPEMDCSPPLVVKISTMLRGNAPAQALPVSA